MRILITGGAGFVGSSLCINLKQRYPTYSFTAFDNLKRRGSELNLTELQENDIKFIRGDIRNKEDFDTVGGFDVLVDASAEPSVLSGIISNPNYVINNNLIGSINCINECLKYNAKLIFLSTSRVYPIDRIEKANYVEDKTRFSFSENQNELGISKMGISENLNLMGPRSFYGTTKLATELFIQEYADFYGLKAAVTRFGVIAGPRQMGKADQGIVTHWLANHFWKKSLRYIGYGGMGKQVRDILHVDDLIDLVDIQIHQIERFKGEVYNAGGGISNSISLLEMTNLCERITGNKILIEREIATRPADLRIYITDNSKIENEIGWKPRYSYINIFEDIYSWIKTNEEQLKTVLV